MFHFNLSQKQKTFLNSALFFSLLVFYMVASTHAFAASGGDSDITGLADKSKGIFNTILTVLQYVSYVAGVFFIFASLFKFDQHKKQPTQIPMSQPITLFVIGAALLLLPTILGYVGGKSGGKISLPGGSSSSSSPS